MSHDYHLYAASDHNEILESAQEKIFLVGGDFGYGNFGDVLQCKNTIAFHRRTSRRKIVVVLGVQAIADGDFLSRARRRYDADAIVYLSRTYWHFSQLSLVREIRNTALVHFYGGGTLNVHWGDHILKVVSGLIRRLRPAGYVISGQQVSAPLHFALADHIKTFQPLLVGVRDHDSEKLLGHAGTEASFCFDDACESLLTLAQSLPLQCGHGLALHLNTSAYTSNLLTNHGLAEELSQLASHGESCVGITVLQAFEASQFDVCDSYESIKRLSSSFPFHDFRVLDLVRLLESSGTRTLRDPITAAIGYSCSYHTALWLQLAGIPCWLRSGNSFYSQKKEALQVRQTLGEFLAEPHLADHSESLERRAAWLERLERKLGDLPPVSDPGVEGDSQPEDAPPWTYRGLDTPLARLTELVESQRAELGDLSERVVALNASTARLGSELHERNHAFWLLEQERDRLGRELHERNHAFWLLEQERDRLGRELHERNHAFWVLEQLRQRLQQENEQTHEALDQMTRRFHSTLPQRGKWFLRRLLARIRRGSGG